MTDTPAGPEPIVSVVVPVYNPGPYIERCISSLLAQSLAPGAFEVVFVDDGSTDATPARLDALAAQHPHIQVIHQPNSGWPGKPRNVGVDAARGRYVYFVDHDDALAPEALERLAAFADRNDSDIVIGKMAGHGRGVPRVLFTETRERVTIHDSGIISSLSPHKFYRTSFLREHGIRFPEGRRRLEDHVFVLETYFAARVISIYSDYTCYLHLARDDRANAATGAYDPTGGFDARYYYSFLREALDVVEKHTQPGPARDRLLRRFVKGELLARLSSPRFVVLPADQQRLRFDEVRAVVDRYIPGSVEAILPAALRTQLNLVRNNRLDLLIELATFDQSLSLAATCTQSRSIAEHRFRLEADVEVRRHGRLVALERADGEALLPVPPRVAMAVPIEARLIGSGGSRGLVIALRRQRDSAELIVAPGGNDPDAGHGGAAHATFDIDLDGGREGGDMRTGRWDAIVRWSFAGYRQLEAPLRRPDRFGRLRPVRIHDGELVAGDPRWHLRERVRQRMPAVAWRLASHPRMGRIINAIKQRTR